MRYAQIIETVSNVFPIPATPENIARAKAFVFGKWRERATERGHTVDDLSGACKFSSLFAQRVFGGKIKGNHDHQYVVLDDGQILDLNADAADVRELSIPYRHDRRFWNNKEHRESLNSCLPRVETWLKEFENELRPGHVLEGHTPCQRLLRRFVGASPPDSRAAG